MTTNDKIKADEAQKVKGSNEGKMVFTPDELNQAGEDKEYFHPDGDHKYKVPEDANENALTPDVEVTPEHKVKAFPKE
ncbi:MAG: hypothetical protein WBQ60_03100 [Asticcacaulis sp.]